MNPFKLPKITIGFHNWREFGYEFFHKSDGTQIFTTATNRATSPMPKYKPPKNLGQATKQQRIFRCWLLEEAIMEAFARQDSYSVNMFCWCFKQEFGKALATSEADIDNAYYYLFSPEIAQAKTLFIDRTIL